MNRTTTPATKPTGESQRVLFENVSKRYADGTLGVENLNLECEAGKITVFVGPSGCGKTTTLRMINRMINPTSGTILIGDKDVTKMEESQLRRGIGYVIQNAGLFPHRNILDNIATVPVLLGQSKRTAREEAVGLLERVGLDVSLAKKYPYQLSGGQQQRVGVARALAADPPVLLMDEPFSAVDPVVRTDLQNELLRLQSELGKTIVFVTHDMDEAVRLADRIVVFQRGGAIAQAGTPKELLLEPSNVFVRDFTGDSGIKWLSTMDTTDILTDTQFLVRDPIQGPIDSWRLLTAPTGEPEGWLPPHTIDRSDLSPCRRSFVPGSDSMRVAMDSALLSPAGLAVATTSTGTVLGLASFENIELAINARRGVARVGL
ncbi:ABC transporter ATP-binding protein [Glutamicibacter sp. NPDC087344]|uniref:ABC transporter ATP-binding protein n=1 Tax=Glutamicibacter sp. NPDC087344 TaxID=3363994 RepID=UPI0037F68F38